MDLRQLRYFLAVAEELHFSRAAARLNLAPSALSAQVRALEAEVGGPLLERSTRRVGLTPAGAGLARDAAELLAGAEAALGRAQALARGETGRITIGSIGPAGGGLLGPLLARLSARAPGLRVEVRVLRFSEIVAALRERHVDLAFVYEPLHAPELTLVALASEPRVVVLPREHRLAGRAEVGPEELRGETFVTHAEAVPEAWRDFWLLADELGGRPPLSPRTADTLEDWLTLIGRGAGIDTAPAIIARYYAWPDVAFVALRDAAPARLALARRAGERDATLDEVVALAREVAGVV